MLPQFPCVVPTSSVQTLLRENSLKWDMIRARSVTLRVEQERLLSFERNFWSLATAITQRTQTRHRDGFRGNRDSGRKILAAYKTVHVF